MVAYAVCCEPISVAESPDSRENTGNHVLVTSLNARPSIRAWLACGEPDRSTSRRERLGPAPWKRASSFLILTSISRRHQPDATPTPRTMAENNEPNRAGVNDEPTAPS